MKLHSSLSLLCLLPAAALLLHLQPTSAAAGNSNYRSNATDFIRTNCAETPHPEVCYKSLSRHAKAINGDPAKLAQFAILISLPKVRDTVDYISNMSSKFHHGGRDHRTAMELAECVADSDISVDSVLKSLRRMRRIKADNNICSQIYTVQIKMSAVDINWEMCSEAINNVLNRSVKKEVSDRGWKMMVVVDIALAFVNSFAALHDCLVPPVRLLAISEPTSSHFVLLFFSDQSSPKVTTNFCRRFKLVLIALFLWMMKRI